MSLPLSRSFTFSLPGYQGPAAGGVGCLWGTHGMHPEGGISVLSHWSLWEWGWFGWQKDGTETLSSPILLALKGWPQWPPQWLRTPSVPRVRAAFGRVTSACVWPSGWNLIWKALLKWQEGIPWQIGSTVWEENQPSASLLNHHPPQGWEQLTSPLSFHEVLEGKAQWKTKCHIINSYFGEIFFSTEQTLQVTHLFNGVYYFIMAGCYNGQLKHDKSTRSVM